MYCKFQITFIILSLFLTTSIKANKIQTYLAPNQNLKELSTEQLMKRFNVIIFELSQLKKLSETCEPSSIDLIEEIKARNFRKAVKVIESEVQKISVNEWKSIIGNIIATVPTWDTLLADFGKYMKFGTEKFFFFIALERVLEEQYRYLPPTLKELRKDITSKIGKLFKRLLLWNSKLGAVRVLYEIQWSKLIYNETQNLISDALIDVCPDLELQEFFEQIEKDEVNTENNRIFRMYVYGALNKVASENRDQESQFLFQLAWNLRNRTKKFENSQNLYVKYLKELLESFHGCVRSIVNIPIGNAILIKSVKYNEYLYSELQNVTQDTQNDKSINHLVTILPQIADNGGKMFLEFTNNRFWIRNGLMRAQYIDTSAMKLAHLTTGLPKTALKIIPSDRDDVNCYIQNYDSGKFMYAGSDIDKLDALQRFVFSNGEDDQRNPSYLWKFIPFRAVIKDEQIHYMKV